MDIAMSDTNETELRFRLMRADIANKDADTALKAEQLRWEPWKALSVAFGAGLVAASALIAAIAWVLSFHP